MTQLCCSMHDHTHHWIIPQLGIHKRLEGHSVELMYHWQRSSDGSVNKTILKPSSL